jgi:hypothetical protein
MKANEIRVGNELIYDNEYITFDASHWYQIGECTLFLEDFKPIPLTEEWLIKMGFEKDENFSFRWHFYYNDYSVLTYDLDDNCVKIGDSWDFAKATYVHQMQNLTYALTNEELTIKN